MKKLLLTFIVFLTIGTCSQPLGHVFAGKIAWDNAPQDYDLFGLKLDTRPMAAMFSHVAMDRLIGEGSLGDYQIDIAVVRLAILYIIIPEDERGDLLSAVFWSLLPDIIDKGFGFPILHRHGLDTIFDMTPDQTELFEELILFNYVLLI